MMHYQEKLDQLFGKGSLWKHRTMRTVFDVHASEYNETSMEEKIKIVKAILQNGIDLGELIEEYKGFYIEENKSYVAADVENGLLRLLSFSLQN